ncbi:uncharacterized protein SOCE26_050790 [Sorangium cellulosum]|uniref:Uncharacterized protein n=1 Tax=Sorangium cellulosum TaxID=56 RepID=A0A2L0EWF3_SORCE|nr:hypothetical protein [Sorangium cellulosum]AUX43627.1 uncharacterized protein SOCE26_050790 [Sorangium cellulosum]
MEGEKAFLDFSGRKPRLLDATAGEATEVELFVMVLGASNYTYQDQLSALEARLRAAKVAPSALDLELRRLEKEARQRLGDLRATLERNPEEARKAPETILGGPLRFTPIETPEGKRYRIEGVVALEAVVAVEGNEARAVQAASPAGFGTLGQPAARPSPPDLAELQPVSMGFAA